jgi:hypothetical protein
MKYCESGRSMQPIAVNGSRWWLYGSGCGATSTSVPDQTTYRPRGCFLHGFIHSSLTVTPDSTGAEPMPRMSCVRARSAFWTAPGLTVTPQAS